MKISVLDKGEPNWDKEIPKIERDLNSTLSTVTGKTPYEALLGYLPRWEEGNLRKITRHCKTYECPTVIQEKIRERIEKVQQHYKERYDRNRYTNVKFKIGDIVFMKRNPI